MNIWDVFHTDRLEAQRGLTTVQVRESLAKGLLRPEDLARPAGSSEGWKKISEVPGLTEAPPKPATRPIPARHAPSEIPTAILLDDLDEVQSFGPANSSRVSVTGQDRSELREISQEIASEAQETRSRNQSGESASAQQTKGKLVEVSRSSPAQVASGPTSVGALVQSGSSIASEGIEEDCYEGEDAFLAEDAEAADFTMAARGGKEKEEDLDLAAMADVAFQLIMFFIVTAASVFFKSMEIPTPNPDKEKSAEQAVARTIEDLSNENILVEIDKLGQFQVDHKPVAPENLIPELRKAREETGRLTMLIMADTATPHKHAVAAYDAANEIGLTIKVGKLTAED